MPEFVVPQIQDFILTLLLDNVKNSITVDVEEMGITLKASTNARWHVKVFLKPYYVFRAQINCLNIIDKYLYNKIIRHITFRFQGNSETTSNNSNDKGTR